MKVMCIIALLLKLLIPSETFDQTLVKMCNRKNLCKIDKIDNSISNDHELRAIDTIEVLESVNTIKQGAFKNLHYLRVIKITGVNLKEINPGCFINLPRATNLNLENNSIEKIKIGVFNNQKFEIIILSGNNISSIDNEAFANMSNLYSIALDNNKLTRIEGIWFDPDNGVRSMDLSNNLITHLSESDGISTLVNLQNLDLHSNSIKTIEKRTFKGFNEFVALNVANNHLENIAPGAFKDKTEFGLLDLSLNNLTKLPDSFLRLSVQYLYINLDPWICNFFEINECIKWISSYPTCVVLTNQPHFCDIISTECSSQDTFNQTLLKMCNQEKICEIEVIDKCISNLVLREVVTIEIVKNQTVSTLQRGAFKNLHNLTMINMTEVNLQEIKPGCFVDIPKIAHLHLKNNHIEKIKSGVFEFLSFENIILSNNLIDSIHDNAFTDMPNLYFVALDNNKIRIFEQKWFGDNTPLHSLDLSNNLITTLHPRAFEKLESLANLNLRFNSIKVIEATTFHRLQQLTVLNLENNHLEYINLDAFENPTEFVLLDLSFNNLTSLSAPLLRSIRVEYLYLQPNPWICKCLDKILSQGEDISVVDPKEDAKVKWITSSYPYCIVVDERDSNICNERFVRKSSDVLILNSYFTLISYKDMLLNWV